MWRELGAHLSHGASTRGQRPRTYVFRLRLWCSLPGPAWPSLPTHCVKRHGLPPSSTLPLTPERLPPLFIRVWGARLHLKQKRKIQPRTSALRNSAPVTDTTAKSPRWGHWLLEWFVWLSRATARGLGVTTQQRNTTTQQHHNAPTTTHQWQCLIRNQA